MFLKLFVSFNKRSRDGVLYFYLENYLSTIPRKGQLYIVGAK